MKNKIMKHQKLIISVIMGILGYITLVFQDYIDNFNVLLLVVFIIFIIFTYKSDLFNKEYRRFTFLLSVFLAIIYLLGMICFNFRYNPTYSVWGEFFSLKSIIYIGGYTSLFYTLLINIIPVICEAKVIKKFTFKRKINVFLIASLIIFICWLPYFLIYYPGFFTNDSIAELNMIVNNFSTISDHHTVIHLLFMTIPYNLGMALFNNSIIAASLITITQMVIMSLIFGKFIDFLYKRGVNKYILLAVLLYFAIIPVHAFYSISNWKDIIFSGLVLLLTMELVKLLEKKKITFRNSYTFIIVSILTVFFRNNAIYMYIILAFVTLIVFRKQIKIVSIMLLTVFAVYFIIKGPVYNYFDVKMSSSTEYLAIPLQQIGRMAYKGVDFTEEEEKLINKLIPVDTLRESYNPEIVDSIKFNDEYNAEVFEKNKFEYFKLWASLCFKHFDIATEAYLTSTLGYWYPNIDYWTVVTKIDKNNIDLKDSSLLPSSVKNLTNELTTKNIPILNFFWSIGLGIWLIFISFTVAIKRKNIKSLYIFVPVFGIWLTMMVATPVFAEFRYIYSAFTCLPLLLLSSHVVKSK